MAGHVWDVKKPKPDSINQCVEVVKFALAKKMPPALAITFAGYYCERSRQGIQAFYDDAHWYDQDWRAMTILDRFYAAAVRSGHKYAQGKNSGHYASFTKRVLAELASLKADAPLEMIIDKLQEEGVL